MNSSINFHGFIDLYQEQNAQFDPALKATLGATHHASSHRQGVLIDIEPEDEHLLDRGCWSRNGK